jgi:hypothetical protein
MTEGQGDGTPSGLFHTAMGILALHPDGRLGERFRRPGSD